jgi:ribosomal protein L37E
MGSKTTITMGEVFKATADNCEICAGMWFYDDTGECMRCGHLPREKQ